MQSLARSILVLCRSYPPRWRPQTYARAVPTLVDLASIHRFELLNRRSRSWISQNKMLSSTIKCEETTKNGANVVAHTNPLRAHGFFAPGTYKNSTHRDGAIYNNMAIKSYFDDLTNHNETGIEPMMLSKGAVDVTSLSKGDAFFITYPKSLLQFFSLTLAECHINNGSIKVYGFIATRDDRDMMRNYIFNRGRDDPITVNQGSFFEMTGPKRAIDCSSPVLIEFDMRIKNGEQEEDDSQLIDGAFGIFNYTSDNPIKHRIYGNCGTVDMSLTLIENAVEATVEITISDVHSCFALSVSSFIKVLDEYEEIQGFNGIVDRPMDLKRFVIAVTCDTTMLVKFKLGNDNVERSCSFKACVDGYATQKIQLDLAFVLVKVTWSTLISDVEFVVG